MTTTRIATRILIAIGATSFIACSGSDSSTPAPSPTDSGADGKGDSIVADTSTGDAAADGPTDGGGEASGDAQDADVKDGPPCIRRPFLVNDQPRASAARRRTDWGSALSETASGPLDARTRKALAEVWLDDGLQEHASIAAFARFTMGLLQVGAPPELIVDSQRASLDEVRHARACFALAKRYSGEDVGPGTLSLEGAFTTHTLEDLAALTVHEGCVGETLGVLLASNQRAHATDAAVAGMLDGLVRDELRHAELAWRFVRWAIDVGGASVRAAVVRAFHDASAASMAMGGDDDDSIDAGSWRAHGRVTGGETRAIVRAGLRDIVEPCAGALLGDDAPRALVSAAYA